MRVLIMLLGLLTPVQEVSDFKIRLQTKDGNLVTGTVRLPSAIPIKTKFGEIKVETGTMQYLRLNNDGKVSVTSLDGSTVVGDCSLPAMEVLTPGGKLTINLADVFSISFEPPRVPPPPPPAAGVAAAARTEPAPLNPKVKGFEVRKPFEAGKAYTRGFDPAILLRDGKRAALLDYEAEECVFVTLAGGLCERVKVEGGPSCLVEKDGKIYVANRKSNSLTVIDAATTKVSGRVAVGSSPRWLAAPVLGNVLYLITESERAWVQSLDTRTGQMIGPMLHTQFNGGIYWSLGFISVSPDNRLLITQGEQSTSPSATPHVYTVNGQKITDLQVSHHEDHPSAFRVDYAGARIYAGSRVYSLDLREKIATSIPATICVPHPTKSVVFGLKQTTNRPSGDGSTIITLFDELRMTLIGEIDMGTNIVGLLPTETTLYAVGHTQIYPLVLAGLVPPEALEKDRERRIPIDLSRVVLEADVRKAEALVGEGFRGLESGKIDDAIKSFEGGLALDPLSNAKAGLGAVLVRQKKFTEAVEVLKGLLHYPFRNSSGRALVYVELAAGYAATQQPENAAQMLQEGLRLDPNDAALLRSIGNQHAASGNTKLQFTHWAKSLQSDPKQPDLRKLMDDLIKKILTNTTGVCESCKGDGKFETIVQEEGAARKKIITECRSCKGGGKTWKRPCIECSGTGRLVREKHCEKCWGSGSLIEPAKPRY